MLLRERPAYHAIRDRFNGRRTVEQALEQSATREGSHQSDGNRHGDEVHPLSHDHLPHAAVVGTQRDANAKRRWSSAEKRSDAVVSERACSIVSTLWTGMLGSRVATSVRIALTSEVGSTANRTVSVIDEIGYLPVSQTGAMLFFQLINRRYERASTVLTSNKGFEEWG